MAKINDYYQKKMLMEKLSEELNQLESDTKLQQDLEFERQVRDLMSKFSKDPRDVLTILSVIDPSIQPGASFGVNSKRKPRDIITYINPHNGEIVKTKGGNHKTLREWREKWGKDEVHNWVQN
jgi:hypothetical protein